MRGLSGPPAPPVAPHAAARGHCASALVLQTPDSCLRPQGSPSSLFSVRLWGISMGLIHGYIFQKLEKKLGGWIKRAPQLKWGRAASCIYCKHRLCSC